MSSDSAFNLAIQVNRDLAKLAREQNSDANNLRLRYANERFLYRLGRSSHSDRFVLKGAALFAVWSGSGLMHRPTKDMDFLAFGDPSEEAFISIFREVCEMGQEQGIEPDGLEFLPDTLLANTVRDRDGDTYQGLQISLQARTAGVPVHMNVDIGFGDAITPVATPTDLPHMLNFPAPRLRIYPRETAIAEKFQNMMERGLFNSRLKDYFDIWYLCQHFDFEGATLAQAIAITCERRGTTLPDGTLEALNEFCEDDAKKQQWAGFLRRENLIVDLDLSQIGEILRDFLLPALRAARSGETFDQNWNHLRGWN